MHTRVASFSYKYELEVLRVFGRMFFKLLCVSMYSISRRVLKRWFLKSSYYNMFNCYETRPSHKVPLIISC